MKTRTRRCVICGNIITGYGHNAAPVAEGRCCDECNAEHVIPERIRPPEAESPKPLTGKV